MKKVKNILLITLFIITATQLAGAQKIPVVDSLPVMIYQNKPFIYMPTLKNGQKPVLKRSIGDSTGKYIDMPQPAAQQNIDAYISAVGRGGVDSLKTFLKVNTDTELLAYIRSHPSLDTYSIYVINPKFALAIGGAFLDSTLASEKAGRKVFYQMQVDTGSGPMMLRGRFVVGQGVIFPKPRLVSTSNADSTAKIKWSMRTSSSLLAVTGVNIYVKQLKDSSFKVSNTFVHFEQQADSAVFQAAPTIKPGVPTAFFIRPTDMFGNESAIPSDTVTAYIAKYKPMPVIGQVSIRDTTGGIRLSWPMLDSTIISKGVGIERSNDVGNGYVAIDTVSSTSTSYIDVKAKLGVQYYYRLSFISPDSTEQRLYGGYVGMIHISKTPLAAPYTVNTAMVDKTVKISWSPVPDAVGYYIYRASTDSLSDISSISKLIKDTVFVDTATHLSRRNFYYYVVRSLNKGGKESINSTPVATKFPSGKDKISAPSGLALSDGDRRLHLEWDDMNDVDPYVAGYNICRRRLETTPIVSTPGATAAETAKKFRFEKLNAEPTALKAFDDTKWVDSVKYQYAISAVDDDGFEGPLSASISSRSLTRRTVQLKAPKALMVARLPTGDVQLRWQTGDAVHKTSFVVYRSSTGAPLRQKIATVSVPTFTDKKPAAKQKYTYDIVALLDGDEGPGSLYQSITL